MPRSWLPSGPAHLATAGSRLGPARWPPFADGPRGCSTRSHAPLDGRRGAPDGHPGRADRAARLPPRRAGSAAPDDRRARYSLRPRRDERDKRNSNGGCGGLTGGCPRAPGRRGPVSGVASRRRAERRGPRERLGRAAAHGPDEAPRFERAVHPRLQPHDGRRRRGSRNGEVVEGQDRGLRSGIRRRLAIAQGQGDSDRARPAREPGRVPLPASGWGRDSLAEGFVAAAADALS